MLGFNNVVAPVNVTAKSLPVDKSKANDVAADNETIGVPTAPEKVTDDEADTAALKVATEVNVAVPEVITSPVKVVALVNVLAPVIDESVEVCT